MEERQKIDVIRKDDGSTQTIWEDRFNPEIHDLQDSKKEEPKKLDSLKKEELKELATAKGIPTSGLKKKELIKILST